MFPTEAAAAIRRSTGLPRSCLLHRHPATYNYFTLVTIEPSRVRHRSLPAQDYGTSEKAKPEPQPKKDKFEPKDLSKKLEEAAAGDAAAVKPCGAPGAGLLVPPPPGFDSTLLKLFDGFPPGDPRRPAIEADLRARNIFNLSGLGEMLLAVGPEQALNVLVSPPWSLDRAGAEVVFNAATASARQVGPPNEGGTVTPPAGIMLGSNGSTSCLGHLQLRKRALNLPILRNHCNLTSDPPQHSFDGFTPWNRHVEIAGDRVVGSK